MWRPSPHRRVVSDGPAAYEDEDITLVIKQWPDDLANEAGTAKYLFGFTVNTFVLGTLRVALGATRVLLDRPNFCAQLYSWLASIFTSPRNPHIHLTD